MYATGFMQIFEIIYDLSHFYQQNLLKMLWLRHFMAFKKVESAMIKLLLFPMCLYVAVSPDACILFESDAGNFAKVRNVTTFYIGLDTQKGKLVQNTVEKP